MEVTDQIMLEDDDWATPRQLAGEIGPKEGCYDRLPKTMKINEKNFFRMDQSYPAAFRKRIGKHFKPNLGLLALQGGVAG